MFNEQPLSMEREKGKNVHLTISFLRHGDKDSRGELTERGYKEARDMGSNKEVEKNGIKMYTSPFRRTASTVDAILKGIEKQEKENKVFKTRKRITLAPPEWEHFSVIAKKAKEIEKREGNAGMFRYVMNEPLAQKDLEQWTSALAFIIDRHKRGSRRFYSGSEVELQHITHDMVIGDFLRKVAIFKDEKGERMKNINFDKVGGPINFLEGFDFKVYLDEKGKENSKIIFRGQELEIDKNKFNELVNKFKEEPYEGRTTSQNYKEKIQ